MQYIERSDPSRFADFTDFSDLLLRLYRLSHEQSIDAFQDSALELIKPLLPFDSSMWGTATMTPVGVDIHTIHLYRTSQEMLDAYEPLKQHDLAATEITRHRHATGGFHSPVAFEDPEMRDFMTRFGHENLFISATTDTSTNFLHWISLFRAKRDAHCEAEERQLLDQLRPHLMQALALNRTAHLDRLEPATVGMPRGLAIADLRGFLYHTDPHFEALLRAEWHGWRNGALPAALLERFLGGEERVVGRTLVVRRHVAHRLMFLRARRRCRADELTPRETTIAKMIAQGATHKEIAQQLGRAPATVRNHIQAIYAKLEVGNIAGLIAELRLAE